MELCEHILETVNEARGALCNVENALRGPTEIENLTGARSRDVMRHGARTAVDECLQLMLLVQEFLILCPYKMTENRQGE